MVYQVQYLYLYYFCKLYTSLILASTLELRGLERVRRSKIEDRLSLFSLLSSRRLLSRATVCVAGCIIPVEYSSTEYIIGRQLLLAEVRRSVKRQVKSNEPLSLRSFERLAVWRTYHQRPTARQRDNRYRETDRQTTEGRQLPAEYVKEAYVVILMVVLWRTVPVRNGKKAILLYYRSHSSHFKVLH